MNRERRTFLTGMGAAGALTTLGADSAGASPQPMAVFDEVDARALGVVANDANAAASNSTIINEFFATTSSESWTDSRARAGLSKGGVLTELDLRRSAGE